MRTKHKTESDRPEHPRVAVDEKDVAPHAARHEPDRGTPPDPPPHHAALPGDFVRVISDDGEALPGIVLDVAADGRASIQAVEFGTQPQLARFSRVPPVAQRDGEPWAWKWVAR
jgi:hypothetical protein